MEYANRKTFIKDGEAPAESEMALDRWNCGALGGALSLDTPAWARILSYEAFFLDFGRMRHEQEANSGVNVPMAGSKRKLCRTGSRQ